MPIAVEQRNIHRYITYPREMEKPDAPLARRCRDRRVDLVGVQHLGGHR
jgi:hypothetical protein